MILVLHLLMVKVVQNEVSGQAGNIIRPKTTELGAADL